MKQHILELPIQEWQKKLLKRMIKVNWYESGLDKVLAISDFNFYDKTKITMATSMAYTFFVQNKNLMM